MSDRTYKAMTCAICNGPIPIGSDLRTVAWTPTRSGKKAPNHVECLSPPKPAAPPVVASEGQAGPKSVAATTPPAAAPTGSDAPIYTYHRRINVWWQGQQVGWVEHGVSTKGRAILPVEEEHVDEAARRQMNRDEFGRLRK